MFRLVGCDVPDGWDGWNVMLGMVGMIEFDLDGCDGVKCAFLFLESCYLVPDSYFLGFRSVPFRFPILAFLVSDSVHWIPIRGLRFVALVPDSRFLIRAPSHT